jgi:hypothetical protein
MYTRTTIRGGRRKLGGWWADTLSQFSNVSPYAPMPQYVSTPSGTKPTIGPLASPPETPGDLSNTAFAWDWLTGSLPADMTQQGQAQIQNVADRAKFYYGPGSAAALAAQAEADRQKAQVSGDVSTAFNPPTLSTDPSAPAGIPWWVWAVGAGLVVVAVTK